MRVYKVPAPLIQPGDYFKLCTYPRGGHRIFSRANAVMAVGKNLIRRETCARGGAGWFRGALLLVRLEEIADTTDCLFQVIHTWQCHDTEVVRPWPVERSALDDQQLLGEQ